MSNKSNLWNLHITSSKDVDSLNPNVIQTLEKFIRNPEPGSDFEAQVKHIPESLVWTHLLQMLFSQWYNIKAKTSLETGDIVSFIWYQSDVNEKLLKIFKLHTDEEYRGQHLTYDLVIGLLSENNEFKVKVGKWPNETENPNEASKKLILRANENWFEIDEDNFIINSLRS